MDRLNELVGKNPMLQRLRDVVCQLMLADRQQEELTNYVAGLLTNLKFDYGVRNTVRNVDNVDFDGSQFFKIAGYDLRPVIRQVLPCQGCFSSIEAREYTPITTVYDFVQFRGEFEIPQYRDMAARLGGTTFFIGFVSDVYCRGKVAFSLHTGPLNPAPAMVYDFADYIRPWSSAGEIGGFPQAYQKLTDTSPLISRDGIVRIDLAQSRMWDSLVSQRSLVGVDTQETLDYLRVRGDFKCGFNYVGLAISLGENVTLETVVP